MAETSLTECFLRERTPEAFEPLVRAHLERVRGVLRNLGILPEDADDLAQESWVIAYEQIEQFRGASSFSSWVCGIAVRRGLQFLRNQRRRADLRKAHQDLIASRQSAAAPDNRLSGEEEEARVTRALATLPEELRAVIVLIAVEEMSPAETARVCGCNVALVYWRLHAARKRLKALLKREENHEK